jgi:hypothetical protein
MVMGVVYEAVNMVTGDTYIGLTIRTLERRKKRGPYKSSTSS